MSATKGQRIGIWVIAGFMLVGTIGSFLAIILANKNQGLDQARITEQTAQYQKEYTEYQAKVDAQTAQLSAQYYGTFSQYATRPAAFDAASAKELKTEDIVVGTGDAITADSSFTAYYIGWNPSGKVFDQSIEGAALKAPILASPGGVIQGWTTGASGMKVGGVRELTIPAELAYGAADKGADIPPNTPLKFILMIIPTPETIPAPTMSAELQKYYQTGTL